MKSKLEQNLSELWTLKNQIRLELNQIRPMRKIVCEQKNKSSKKYFPSAYTRTNLTEPREEESYDKKRKHFNYSEIQNNEMSKSREKKHFPLRKKEEIFFYQEKRRSSAYFNREKNIDKQINIFLVGGEIKTSPSKKGIRIIPGTHQFNFNMFHNS